MDPLLRDAPGERHLFLGNEAIVRGALEAGVHLVTCYPGTPSSEVPDTKKAHLEKASIAFFSAFFAEFSISHIELSVLLNCNLLYPYRHTSVDIRLKRQYNICRIFCKDRDFLRGRDRPLLPYCGKPAVRTGYKKGYGT